MKPEKYERKSICSSYSARKWFEGMKGKEEKEGKQEGGKKSSRLPFRGEVGSPLHHLSQHSWLGGKKLGSQATKGGGQTYSVNEALPYFTKVAHHPSNLERPGARDRSRKYFDTLGKENKKYRREAPEAQKEGQDSST